MEIRAQLSPNASSAPMPSVPTRAAAKTAEAPRAASHAAALPPISHDQFMQFSEELKPVLAALYKDGMSAEGQQRASEALTGLLDKYVGSAGDGAMREPRLRQLATIANVQSNILATREMFDIRNAKMSDWDAAHPPEAAPAGSVVKNPYADYVDPKNRAALQQQQAFLMNLVVQYGRHHGIALASAQDGPGILVDTKA